VWHSPPQVANLRAEHGVNELTPAPRASLLSLVKEQFSDRLVQILVAVAAFSAVPPPRQSSGTGEDAGMRSNQAAVTHASTQPSLAVFASVRATASQVTSSLDARGGGVHGGGLAAFAEPLVIAAILSLNAGVGVWQGRSAEGALAALTELQPAVATVLRGGGWGSVPSRELVPGDVVKLRVGDKVPADCRVVALLSSCLSVDEGALTGESATVAKGAAPVPAEAPIQGKSNMAFSGSVVTAGSALAVVVATGMGTEIGTISKGVAAARAEGGKTPLGEQLDTFGRDLSKLIGWVCLATWLANARRFSAPAFGAGVAGKLTGALHYLKVAVALGVAAIPEGLPAVITLCLSLGTRRMAERRVIVRRLPSVETLGCTTVICTDKTGTLTQNAMTAVALVHAVAEGSPQHATAVAAADSGGGAAGDAGSVLVVDGGAGAVLVAHGVSGEGYSPLGTVAGFGAGAEGERGEALAAEGVRNATSAVGRGALGRSLAPSETLRDALAVMILCNDASLHADEKSGFGRTGEPTEAALKVLAEKLGTGIWPELLVEEAGSVSVASGSASGVCQRVASVVERAHSRLATLDFSRDRKSMSVLVAAKGHGRNRLLVKGAPDHLLERCTKVHRAIPRAPFSCCRCGDLNRTLCCTHAS